MIELQFDAGGRRCVEHFLPTGTRIEYDGIIPEGGLIPEITIKPQPVSFLVMICTTAAIVTIGDFEHTLKAREPFLVVNGQLVVTTDSPVTVTPEDANANFTIVVCQ